MPGQRSRITRRLNYLGREIDYRVTGRQIYVWVIVRNGIPSEVCASLGVARVILQMEPGLRIFKRALLYRHHLFDDPGSPE